MAARLNRAHLDLCREKIKTSQLINRLQQNALGEVELTSVQQRSIEILLRKTLPDLTAVAVSGEINTNTQDHADAKERLAALIAAQVEREQAPNGTGKPH